MESNMNNDDCPLPTLVTNFNMVSQGVYNNLCWAAVALSVDHLLNPASNWKQLCDVVGATEPNPTGCCSHPSSPACNHEGALSNALSAHHLQGLLGSEGGPFAGGYLNQIKFDHYWDVIKTDIRGGRVVCAGMESGIRHYVAIYGYQECGAQKLVWVQDPYNDPSAYLPYDVFASKYLGASRWVEVDQIA
jgi:hypothetical protein